MNLVQHPGFPDIRIPPEEGPFSYRNRWQEVMEAFVAAGFDVREPSPERQAKTPCSDSAWYFMVAGLDHYHEVVVTDRPWTPDREEALLRGAFAMVDEHPRVGFSVYSADKLSRRMRLALSAEPFGQFLRRIGVAMPIADIRPRGVQFVAPRIAEIMADCWERPVDLDEPAAVLGWLDDVVMSYRGDIDPDEQLPTPGDVLTPPLAAIGLLVADLLCRHLPGPARVHATVARGEHERIDDDRLEAQDWAFVVAVAGGSSLRYIYGPGKVFARYCQGQSESLLELLPHEILYPESDEARDFVESLPDDPTLEE